MIDCELYLYGDDRHVHGFRTGVLYAWMGVAWSFDVQHTMCMLIMMVGFGKHVHGLHCDHSASCVSALLGNDQQPINCQSNC